ncbi:MAG: CvpA family protein [Planctomycetota bacterium]
MPAVLVTAIIILACVAKQYFKGGTVKAFASLVTSICAAGLAFSFFEKAASLFYEYDFRVAWAQPGCFILIFIISFAILRVIAAKLVYFDVEFPPLFERIGSIVFGAVLGLVLAGILLNAVAMMPIPAKWPYARFDKNRPDPDQPNRIFLNADGFITGLIDAMSSGSFSGSKSFALLHPDFTNQIFLNRIPIDREIDIVTGSKAIIVPRKNSFWPAPDDLTNTTGEPVRLKGRHTLTILRVGIKPGSRKQGGAMDESNRVLFTLSQLRLICSQKNSTDNTGYTAYPIGYLRTADTIQLRPLNESILMQAVNFTNDPNYGPVRWLDLAFHIPTGCVPAFVQFKENAIAQVESTRPAEQPPTIIPFIQPDKLVSVGPAKLEQVSSGGINGLELATKPNLLAGTSLQISNMDEWLAAAKTPLNMETKFDGDMITCVHTELVLPIEDSSQVRRRKQSRSQPVTTLLSPRSGYQIISLKCSNPSTGMQINSAQFPVLYDVSGHVHHPAGLVAAGRLGAVLTYEVAYCSLDASQVPGGLVINSAGTVTKPFPQAFLLPAKAQSISELYLLYLVRPGAFIITAGSPSSKTKAPLQGFEAFVVN